MSVMKFKVGAKIVVKDVHSGGNFENGDIVIVEQIGCEDDPDCYGAISPYDGFMWYLYDDEVGPATNADLVRAMNDDELAEWAITKAPSIGKNYADSVLGLKEWLKQPAEEESRVD